MRETRAQRSHALILKLILRELGNCDTESPTSCAETPESKDSFQMFCSALLFSQKSKTAMKKFLTKVFSRQEGKQIFLSICC